MLPHYIQQTLEKYLERRSDSWWVERKFKNFHIQPVRPMGSTIMEGDKECGHQERRIHMPLHTHGGPDE